MRFAEALYSPAMKKLLGRPKVSNFLARTFGSSPFLKDFSRFLAETQISSVHFVCHGNICRSPYAEWKTKAVWPLPVRSSGLHASPGNGADASALKIAKEFGVDLTGHTTARFDARSVPPEELVVVMEYDHLFEIGRLSPQVASQTLILGALTLEAGRELTILDPWGKNDETFRRCFEHIDLALTELSGRLTK